MKWGLKEGISIDADSGPPRYVLWCCGGICHQLLTFFQIGCGHTVHFNCFVRQNCNFIFCLFLARGWFPHTPTKPYSLTQHPPIPPKPRNEAQSIELSSCQADVGCQRVEVGRMERSQAGGISHGHLPSIPVPVPPLPTLSVSTARCCTSQPPTVRSLACFHLK